MTDRTELRPAETVAETTPTRHEAPDMAELQRLLDALPGFTLKYLGGGPGVKPYITLADGGMPLSDSGWDAVLLFAEIAALEVPRLLDRLVHMTEARDNARAEAERLTAQIEAVRELHEPRVVEVLGPECSAEECDHEDACPLVDCTVCGHCYDVGDGAHCYAYEEGGIENVAYPCATVRALDATPGGES